MYQNVYLTENLYSFFEAEAYFNTMNNGQDWIHIHPDIAKSNYENAIEYLSAGNDNYMESSLKLLNNIYKNCYFSEMKRSDYDNSISAPLKNE